MTDDPSADAVNELRVTRIDGDNYVYWRNDFSGVIEVSLHDGRRFRFDVVNGRQR